MDKKIIMRNVAISVVMMLGAACSNQKENVVRTNEPTIHRINVIEYYVQPRDSLSKISKKLTGTIKNWREIGHFNGVYDPKDLQVGASLLVPRHLVTVNSHLYEQSVLTLHLGSSPDQQSQTEPALVAENTQPKPVQPVQVATKAPTQTAVKLGPVFQPEALPGAPRVQPATRKVNVNRHFNVTYFDAAATNDPALTKMIRVVGTYYPKGIYSEPESSSSLLMRVAPGSTFVLEEYLGDWLKIKTDSGVGYIREIDATILGSLDSQDRVLTTSL